ncbi:uncharacterized protein C1orf131-like [Prorops nasuta]|uniref:uncharacterized protein C1orf131-like n=1 Tax=Prorops nasuta TaxID=863751 RepID=UPI0034CDE196
MDDFVSTKGSKLKESSVTNFVAINYDAPKKKVRESLNIPKDDIQKRNEDKRNNKDGTSCTEMDVKKKQNLEMKRARYDIIKFGMSGIGKDKAKEAKVALAISLGARPPKKKAINYKELQEMKKREKLREARKQKLASGHIQSLKKHKSHKPKRKEHEKGGILGVYGKVNEHVLRKGKK